MGHNLFIPSNEPFQQGVAAIQQTRMRQNALQQQGLQLQAQQRATQKRLELENLLSQSANPERDSLEWAKRNDPELANKLSASYIQRFMATARLDPKSAAAQLENATGEKIELGNRYSKLPIEGGEAYIDNFTGHVFQPNSAKELLDLKNDFAMQLEKQRQEGRKELEGVRAALKPENEKHTVYGDFSSDDPRRQSVAKDYLSRQKAATQPQDRGQYVGQTQEGKAVIFNPASKNFETRDLPTGGGLNSRTTPAQIQQQQQAYQRAEPVIDAISSLSEKINTGQGVLAKISGGVEKAKAEANLNDDVAEYEALISGFTPLVARSLGHVGVLTEQDVQSVKAMFPRPGDSKSLRDRKISRLKSLMGQIKAASAPGQGNSKAESLRQKYGY